MPDQLPESMLDSDITFTHSSFSSLDARILRALADLSFTHPTLVQAKAIPLLLEGKDVLAKAKTGSGKTAAYAVPAVQKVLSIKSTMNPSEPGWQSTRAIIMVPTKELGIQVTSFLKKLTVYCEGLVGICNATSPSASVQRVLLNDNPDIVICTPSRLIQLLHSSSVSLQSLVFLAIDEADLLLSYGHKDDLVRIMDPTNKWVPKLGMQACLMSATLGEEMDVLKGLILRNPAILTLSEPTSSDLLTQYFTHTSERDKFLLIYVLLKLKLIRGRSIVFVNDVDRGYRVKLFLEQFGVKACVVNSELPLASRYHVVEEFNRGVYDVVVATDEGTGTDPEPVENAEVEDETEQGAQETEIAAEDVKEEAPAESSTQSRPSSKRLGKRRRQDPASSMARGIDFTSASSVINFDLPTSSTSYMHRVGRTARAGHSGLALSFIVPRDKWGKDKNVSLPSAKDDEQVWERIQARMKKEHGSEMKDWDWSGKKSEIEGFRYRMEDGLRAVTGKRVAEARREEVKRELLNNEKLKAHFAANPLDLAYLRHDAPLHPARSQPHLKHVPAYLQPKISGIPRPVVGGDVRDGDHIHFNKRGRGNGGGRGGRGRGGNRGGSRKTDPLKFKR
ncbi:P-loop containing nucleoside triphosphate hydrolase protein [Kockovaella imperatae]|uniref:RNA helicase n=1 Tax=Kockovaella imperatae TaxID=4999 RepID=A0A1Y1UH60_9TREE|nr:P-loop containing nucleoside triphosphate hydrolase protein [Kockovaella imperatae]ORX37388.1 P-loop containing nucleoside triphosphate hydrolase protein [Kockovaella imperatae]